MPAPERAFLDANAIRGQLTTDVLLSVAYAKAFRPRWSENVLDEMRRNRPPGLPEARIDHRIQAMNRAFPRAMVSGHEHLIPQMQADDKDRHVLAAAVHGGCHVLVTENTKDFDPPASGPHAMRVERPSAFLNRHLQENPGRVVQAMREMVQRNKREPRSMPELVDLMARRQDLAGFARNLNAELPAAEQGSDPGLRTGPQPSREQSAEAGRRPPEQPAGSVALDGVAPARGAVERSPGPAPARFRPNAPDSGRGQRPEHPSGR